MHCRSSYRRRRRIFRSREDNVFFGVCGGIAEHFGWSAWAVRFGLIALTILWWWPALAYVIAGLMMPLAPPRPVFSTEDEEFYATYEGSRSDALRKVRRSYEQMEKRLQRLESVVTRPGFDLDEEFRKL